VRGWGRRRRGRRRGARAAAAARPALVEDPPGRGAREVPLGPGLGNARTQHVDGRADVRAVPVLRFVRAHVALVRDTLLDLALEDDRRVAALEMDDDAGVARDVARLLGLAAGADPDGLVAPAPPHG